MKKSTNYKNHFIVAGILAAVGLALLAYLMFYVAPAEVLETVKVVAVTPVEPVKVALPACVVEPMLIVSAATAAPEKVTSAGAVSAVANNTLIVLLVLVSVILPATVIAPV